MVYITALWLPIVVSAVLVFVASSIIHMMLPIHRKDYDRLAGEEDVLTSMRDAGVTPGDYMFPFCHDIKEMGSDEMTAKFNRGPVGFVTLLPNGPMAIGKSLVQWFVYTLVVGWLVAYVTGRTFGPGANYLEIFRVAGTAAFLAYVGAQAQLSIWGGRSWLTTVKHSVDGLIYALVTAGAFGWLWPY